MHMFSTDLMKLEISRKVSKLAAEVARWPSFLLKNENLAKLLEN